MRTLATRIRRELKRQTTRTGHCAIYEEDLQRSWPLTQENREAEIAKFAKEHGFKLRFYKHGLCAILVKDYSTGR
jgi:hypothetical protein